jgi:hypothetical protein
MAVLSRERAAETGDEDTRAGLQLLARSVILARAAGPAAKAAGVTARDGARSAATWAAPHVNGARAWTAPHLEWSGLVIRDTVGPRIYEALTATARRVDVTAPRADVEAPRRHWSRILAGAAVLTAAGAAAAIVLRRRKDDGTGGQPGESAVAGTGPQAAQDGAGHADTDGGASAEDGSSQSNAT